MKNCQVLTRYNRKATEDSILAIQIFDQKKFKKKDQGFLGVINVRIGDVIDLDVGGDGSATTLACLLDLYLLHLQKCSLVI
jgi:E3 ubiquitin-protein ligase NEDD4